MTDRLKDLKRGAVNAGDVAIDIREGEKDALNKKKSAENSILSDFFGDVELVKKNINVIKNVTKRIGEIQQQVVLATTNHQLIATLVFLIFLVLKIFTHRVKIRLSNYV